MALIKCPECGKEISDKAKTCIHCGYPMPKAKQLIRDKDNDSEQSITSPIDQKRKKKIIIVAVIVVFGILAIWGITSAINNNAAKTRDLSDVFDLSFDMTMEDIIEYEATIYGNSEYERENLSDVIRLDFEKYSSKWKHRYFFDNETGLLTHFSYTDIIITFGDEDKSECEHIDLLERALLNEIGEWDKKDGVNSIAYGQIDGVPCKIIYFNVDGADGAIEEISVHTDEK